MSRVPGSGRSDRGGQWRPCPNAGTREACTAPESAHLRGATKGATMSFDTRAGTRGLAMEGSKVNWWMDRQMARQSVRKVFALFGFDVLVLTTLGHRTGIRRTNQVCWFPGKEGSWLIVAAAGGTRVNPAWYYNLAAHPDEVEIEIGSRTIAVTAEQLHGDERAQAWQQITTAAPRFARFQSETDRELPVIRLTPRSGQAAPSDSRPEQP